MAQLFKHAHHQPVFESLPGPKAVWNHLLWLVETPRGSGDCKAVTEKLIALGKQWGLDVSQDKIGNVLIRKPAHPGFEHVPSVCVQSHVDMVCVHDGKTSVNFKADPLRARVTEHKGRQVLMATGTSLGADNGIGVAFGLALLEDKSLKHGPLECLFTIDEETTMVGASEIEPGWLKSKILINADSEEDDCLCIGCAGGFESTIQVPLTWVETKGARIEVDLHGGLGGHSGVEIHLGRACFNKVLARILVQAWKNIPGYFRLASYQGGEKRNVICSKTTAVIVVPQDQVAACLKEIEAQYEVVRAEWKTLEKDMALATKVLPESTGPAMDGASTERFLQQLLVGPHGVLRWSPDVPGLVESSINLAIVRASPERPIGEISFFARSSSNSQMPHIYDCLVAQGKSAGCTVTPSEGNFPGWLPNPESPLLGIAKRAFAEVHKKEAKIYAIHAGLECGMFQAKYPGMDCISLGPLLTDVHSPAEKLFIDTVGPTFEVLTRILEHIPPQ